MLCSKYIIRKNLKLVKSNFILRLVFNFKNAVLFFLKIYKKKKKQRKNIF